MVFDTEWEQEEIRRSLEKKDTNIRHLLAQKNGGRKVIVDQDGVTFIQQAVAEEAIAELLSRPAARGGDDLWQPIETVPRDGTLVDLWLVYGSAPHYEGMRFPQCLWRNGEWYSNFGHMGQTFPLKGNPTHWRLLPDDPGKSPTIPQAGLTADIERVQDVVSDWAASLLPQTHVDILAENGLARLRDAILALTSAERDGVEALPTDMDELQQQYEDVVASVAGLSETISQLKARAETAESALEAAQVKIGEGVDIIIQQRVEINALKDAIKSGVVVADTTKGTKT